ncbi:MAG: GNAT family N-acetyltransferase [Flavobacteriaceae bacterium]
MQEITLGDYKDLYEIRYHPEVLKYIKREKVEDKLEIRSFILDRLNDIESSKIYFWKISAIDDAKLMGTICLWNFSNKKTVAEIGYELHPDFHGKGFMSEAMETVLNFGFTNLQLKTIEAYTSKYNESSKVLLNKFGFKLETDRKDNEFSENIIYIKQNA